MRARDRIIVTLLGALGLVGLIALALNVMDRFSMLKWDAQLWNRLLWTYCGALLAGGALAYALAPRLDAQLRRFIAWLARITGERPLPELLLGLTGSIMGLAIAFCISTLISGLGIGLTGAVINAAIYLALGTAGYALIGKRWRELPHASALSVRARAALDGERSVPKVLDTSVLIDGRIFDICRTGFIEGPLVVPRFVLAELQRIADSADALKRNRGRRGLDIVARIQKELDIELTIDETDFDDMSDVDVKLLKLTQLLRGRVMTNDFNLNKVAEVSGVGVLNVNELAGALKPALLPGEELTVQIVREGKELGQGVAFMDDGTMIVVENGRRHIGQSVTIAVNTVLQTAAGRMIFARLREKAAG